MPLNAKSDLFALALRYTREKTQLRELITTAGPMLRVQASGVLGKGSSPAKAKGIMDVFPNILRQYAFRLH